MKAYGFALTPNQNNCFGIVIDEQGTYRGHHTSSNYSWLKTDLASKAPECAFEFIENDIPYKNIIYSLVNEINSIGNDKAKNDEDYLKLSAENNKLTKLLKVAREAHMKYLDDESWIDRNRKAGWNEAHYIKTMGEMKEIARQALAKLDAIERGEG